MLIYITFPQTTAKRSLILYFHRDTQERVFTATLVIGGRLCRATAEAITGGGAEDTAGGVSPSHFSAGFLS